MANANKSNVTKRGSLSRPLTVSEGDQNFQELINVIEDVNQRTIYAESLAELPDSAEGSQATINGVQFVKTASGWRRLLPLDSNPELIAHRGFKNVGIEGTLPALATCVIYGADSIEFDVQPSGDGTLYVFHDITVDSLMNGSGTFTSLTDSQIEDLVFTQANGTPLEGIGIPLLSDVLRVLKKVKGRIYPEIKRYSVASELEAMVNAVKDAGLSDRCTWQSFTFSDLEAARDIDPLCEFGFLVSSGESLSDLKTEIDNIAGSFVRGSLLSHYTNLLNNPSIVSYARDAGVGLAAWTVNELEDYIALRELGVNRIMSDYNLGGALK